MKKILISMLMISLLATSCLQPEEDDDDDGLVSDVANAVSCITSQICYDYTSSGLTSAQVNEVCRTVSGATASANACPASNGGQNSNGTCAISGDMNSNVRMYFNNAAQEEAMCTTAEGSGGLGGTWSADFTSARHNSNGTYYCHYNNKCLRLDRITEENADNFCYELGGYLDTDC